MRVALTANLIAGCGAVAEPSRDPARTVAVSARPPLASSAPNETAAPVDPELAKARALATQVVTRCRWDDREGFQRWGDCRPSLDWLQFEVQRQGVWLNLLESAVPGERFLAMKKLSRPRGIGLEPLLSAAEKETVPVLRTMSMPLLATAELEARLTARVIALVDDQARPMADRKLLLGSLGKRARSDPATAEALAPLFARVLREGPPALRPAAAMSASCERATALLDDDDDAVFIESAAIVMDGSIGERADAAICRKGAGAAVTGAKRRALAEAPEIVALVLSMEHTCYERKARSLPAAQLGNLVFAAMRASRATLDKDRWAWLDGRVDEVRWAIVSCAP